MKFEKVLDDYYIDPKYLSTYRLLYCFIILFIIGLPSYTWIANSLDYLFSPPILSPAALFNKLPESWFFITLTIFNLCFFMLMFLGVASRWTSLLFSITCIIGHNFWYSFGKIDHLLLWYIAPAFLGFAGWGKYFSLKVLRKDTSYMDVQTNTNSILILTFALSIGFSMFTSGAEKVYGGWLNWGGEGVRFNFIRNFLVLNSSSFLTQPLIAYKNHFFWKALDYSALIMELGFIISVLKIKFFRFFIAVGVVFHTLVLLMFDIAFYSNLMVYLIFIDWYLLYERWNIGSVFNSRQKEKTCVRFMILISISFTLSWLILLCQKTYFFNFHGLLESILGVLSVPDPFGISLLVFFLLVFLFMIYLIYCHLNLYRKSINQFE